MRVFLIIPWAMPQYIAALTWKGMFNQNFGAINLMLGWFGVQNLPWLSDPKLTFYAAIITNIRLGFPFMMMITLGGLQSISAGGYGNKETQILVTDVYRLAFNFYFYSYSL